MHIQELQNFFEQILEPNKFQDNAHNGLQISGQENIQKIIFGVSANQALIERAIQKRAQAIFVHHGLFWSPGLIKLTGFMRKRVKLLLEHDINLLAYHLPLDAHPILGNNAQIFSKLGLEPESRTDFGKYKNNYIGFNGKFKHSYRYDKFIDLVEQKIGKINFCLGAKKNVFQVAICSGAAPELIYEACELGCDAFICGEATEWVTHIAQESNLAFIAAGHHQTEVFGPKAMCDHVLEKLDINCEFVNIYNPV